MSKASHGRRPRRQFSEEFKEGAVRLVLDEGQTVGAAACELDRTASALGLWQEPLSRKRIIRLMQEDGLKARVRKRYKGTTMSDHDQPVAANLLRQEFTAARPNQRWVGDTSELRIGENGKAYLADVLDLISRFVVGWAISALNDRHLTITALDTAVKRRCPAVGLLHHSDQGSTYASEDYQAVLAAHGTTCSMSRRGNRYDNAVMESCFSTVKNEVGERYESHGDATGQLFDYIEVFYNQRRRHSSAGRMGPHRPWKRIDRIVCCRAPDRRGRKLCQTF